MLVVLLLLLFFFEQSNCARSARRRGDVTLGGLFPIHEYGHPREPCGTLSAFRGIQRLEAMLFAIEQINHDRHLLPGIELGALIFDTCSDDNYALEQSLRFVRNRLASSSCICTSNTSSTISPIDHVFGVVGASLSSVSVHVANLLRLFQLPQISYASTTPKLSESSFDYFARTVPSDSNQARAIVDILQRLNFTYVNTIYSHGDYGEGGFREFKRFLKLTHLNDDEKKLAKNQRICIADEQRLKRDASVHEIQSIFETMIDRVTSDVQVRVYVLFVTKEDARKLLQAIKLFNGTHRPVLIASDAWGKESSVVIQGETDEIAVGALTLELVSIQPYNFDKYFNSLKPDILLAETIDPEYNNDEDQFDDEYNQSNDLPKDSSISSRNPWFNEFWEQKFNCNLNKSISCAQHQLNESNWDSKLQFIVDATYVFAQALHTYLNCSSSICSNRSFNNINGTRLFQIILEKTFSMPDFRQIQFNSERFVPGHYRIYNYRRSHQGNSQYYEYISVGEWKIDRNQAGQLNLAIDSIVWPGTGYNENVLPISRCSEPCRVGELKQVQGDSCCWVCLPCNETSVVVEIDEQEVCQGCPLGYWPNTNRTLCYKLKETSIEFFSIQALLPIGLAILGNIFTMFVMILFYQKRHTPVVKASGQELCFTMLIGIHICYLMTFAIIFRPTVMTCIIQRLGVGLGFAMMYAALLTKTNRIARIFESTKLQGTLRLQYISPHSQLVICSGLIFIQLLLSLIWLAYERPSVDMIASERSIVLKCHMHKNSFLISLGYNVLLLLICTMYAIRTRKVPENFNETKFIGFTCYTTCIIWLAFLPIYFTAYETGRHQIHITTLCMTISLSATVALACLFCPKVYIIVFHPEKNMRLTKQLKAQATQIKFASQIVTNTSLVQDPQGATLDLSTSDGLSKSGISNDQDENLHPLVTRSNSVRWTTTYTNPDHDEQQQLMFGQMKRNPRKLPMIIMNNRSDNGSLKDDQYQVSIEKTSFDDNHEQIIL